MAEAKLRALACGLEELSFQALNRHVTALELVEIKNSEEFGASFEQVTDESFHIIVCGPAITDLSAIEIAQTYRTQAPNVKIYFLSTAQAQIDFAGLAKNGFNEVYILPADESLLGQKLREDEREITGSSKLVYHSVPVTDFEAGTEIEFSVSVYLPLNGKHIKLLKSGGKVEEAQINKFKKHSVNSLTVEEGELNKFIEYSAAQLKKSVKNQGTSHAAKTKLQNTVRDLFRNLTSDATGDFSAGKSLFESSQKIVNEFISVKPAQALHEKLMAAQGVTDDNVYAHCGRVSSLVALLSLGTRIGEPQELAIAGLFHDVGKIRLPPEIQAKPFATMTPEEKNAFKVYPEESLKILQEKRMGVSDKVRNVILQQLERFDGKGLPKQLPPHKIEQESFLLMIADQLDEQLRSLGGGPVSNINDIFARIETSGAISPAVLSAVKQLLFQSEDAVA